MRKISEKIGVSILCSVFLIIVARAAWWGEESTPEDVYMKALRSIMTLKVETKDNSSIIGTAFLAVEERIAVTAWQIVKDAQRVVARFPNGEEFHSSGLVDKDVKRNLALLRIKVFGRPMLTCDPSEPAVGSPI
ncbi:MAG: hypothetical protein ACE5LC_04020 [Candidatus Aminicenantales bacterium]